VAVRAGGAVVRALALGRHASGRRAIDRLEGVRFEERERVVAAVGDHDLAGSDARPVGLRLPRIIGVEDHLAVAAAGRRSGEREEGERNGGPAAQ
jgi:hypothetical protein